MGEESTSLLEAAVETPTHSGDEAVGAVRKRRLTRRGIAIAIVGALVIAGGTVGGVAWANQIAHENAVADAEAAHAAAAHAAAAHRATLVWLDTSVDAGIALRDSVATGVLARQDLLGGGGGVAAVAESSTDLGATLAELFGVDAPTIDSVIPDAGPLPELASVDPELGTDQLTALAAELVGYSREADESREGLAARAAEVDTAIGALGHELGALASSLPQVNQALLEGHTLASAEAKATAAGALASFDGASDASLPGLIEAYATAASGIVASHDAEAARIAAEAARVAAEEAAKKARRSTGGGGGTGTQQRGVLSESNAQRAANGLGALSWNGTLAAAACTWASKLAAADGGLSHSKNPGGFGWWGENVASGYGSVSAAVNGWMNSPDHRANILRPQFTLMGACSMDAADGTRYWVQQFGS